MRAPARRQRQTPEHTAGAWPAPNCSSKRGVIQAPDRSKSSDQRATLAAGRAPPPSPRPRSVLKRLVREAHPDWKARDAGLKAKELAGSISWVKSCLASTYGMRAEVGGTEGALPRQRATSVSLSERASAGAEASTSAEAAVSARRLMPPADAAG